MKRKYLTLRKGMLCLCCILLCLTALDSSRLFAIESKNTDDDIVMIIDDADTGDGLHKIKYSEGWTGSTGDKNSYKGTYHFTKLNETIGYDTKTLSVRFKGKRIELYGPKRNWFGVYAIQIDDEAPVMVDAYSSSDLWSQKVYDSGELREDEHTLTLQFMKDKQAPGRTEANIDYFKVYSSKTKATDVSIEGGNFEMKIGESKQLHASILPEDAAAQDLIWSVSDSAKAKISSDGTLEAYGAGKIEVIATIKDTDIEDRVIADIQSAGGGDYITFINDAQEGEDFFQVSYEGIWGQDKNYPQYYYKGDSHWSNSKSFGDVWPSYTINFIGTKIELYGNKDTLNAIYDIQIDGESVAKVDAFNEGGRIRQQKLFESDILKDGKHTLTVALLDEKRPGYEDKNHEATFDYARVYHNAIAAKDIIVHSDNILLEQGMEVQLTPHLFPSYTTVKNPAFTYTVEDSRVATIDKKGVITAMSAGKTTVTIEVEGLAVKKAVTVEVLNERGNLRAAVTDIDHHYYQEDYDELKDKLNFTWHGSAWRNDEMLSEIALTTLDQKASDVEVVASDFVNENGDILSAEHITIDFLRETSAHVGHGANATPADKQPHKNVPDIIYQGGKMDIAPNRVQNVWLNIAVPLETKSGIYTGMITVKSKEQADIVLTYTFDVYNIIAPNPEDYKKTLELWEYPFDVAKYYNIAEEDLFGTRHLDILRENLQLYKEAGGTVSNGVILNCDWGKGNPMGATGSLIGYTKTEDGTMEYDYTYFDKWFGLNEELGLADKIKLFSVSKEWTRYYDAKTKQYVKIDIEPGSDRWYAFWSEFLQDFIPHLEEMGWVDKTYFAVDEIPEEQIKHFLNLLEQNTVNGKKLKLSAAVNYSHMSEDTMMKIDDVSISLYYIDRNQTTRHIIERRKELGLSTTFYTCVGTYPNSFALNNPADSAWTIWYNNALGFDGYLRWAYNCWVPTAYDNLDYVKYEAGDTMFIYPDDDRYAETPRTRSTPRYENMKQARRDVEKFNFLMAQSEELNKKGEALLDSLGRNYGAYNSYGGVYAKNEEEAEYIVTETNRMRDGLVAMSKFYVETRVIDKQELQEAIEAASLLQEVDYAPVSWSMLETALKAAEDMLRKMDAMQEDVDAALRALKAAEEALIRKADKNALVEAVKTAQGLKKALYEDFSGVEKALEKGKAVQKDENATQKEVDDAVATIKAAIKGLKFKTADHTELNHAIKKAESLYKADYTEESWEALEAALKKAKEMQNADIRKQEEVDRATAQLYEAIENLQIKEVKAVKEELHTWLEVYGEYRSKDYTKESWNIFKAVYEQARAVYMKETATQEEVDQAIAALKKASKKLVKVKEEKPDNEKSENPVETGEGSAAGMILAIMIIGAGIGVFAGRKKYKNNC